MLQILPGKKGMARLISLVRPLLSGQINFFLLESTCAACHCIYTKHVEYFSKGAGVSTSSALHFSHILYNSPHSLHRAHRHHIPSILFNYQEERLLANR